MGAPTCPLRSSPQIAHLSLLRAPSAARASFPLPRGLAEARTGSGLRWSRVAGVHCRVCAASCCKHVSPHWASAVRSACRQILGLPRRAAPGEECASNASATRFHLLTLRAWFVWKLRPAPGSPWRRNCTAAASDVVLVSQGSRNLIYGLQTWSRRPLMVTRPGPIRSTHGAASELLRTGARLGGFAGPAAMTRLPGGTPPSRGDAATWALHEVPAGIGKWAASPCAWWLAVKEGGGRDGPSAVVPPPQ